MTDNQSTDFFDNIGGSGAPSAQLKNQDDFVYGEIVEMFKKDYVPFGKTEPEKDDKEPDGIRKQLVVILQTANRNWAGVSKIPVVDHNDPNSPTKDPAEDDGKRAVYVPNRSNLQYAIGRAVTGVKFEVGGTLGVKVFNLKDTGKGNPLKEHEAKYTPKPVSTGAEFFDAAPAAPAQAAPVATPAPAAPAPTPAPAAPAAPAQVDPWATPGAPAAQEQPPF